MELGAAVGGIRGRRARLGADQGLAKATAVHLGADQGEAAKGAAGQGRRRPGAGGVGSSRSVQGRPASVRRGRPALSRGARRGSPGRGGQRQRSRGERASRDVAGEKTREDWGILGGGASGASTRGPTCGRSEAFCGMDPTKLGCEARSELPNLARLRGLICMSWAVLR
jgi:hypothetical protein